MKVMAVSIRSIIRGLVRLLQVTYSQIMTTKKIGGILLLTILSTSFSVFADTASNTPPIGSTSPMVMKMDNGKHTGENAAKLKAREDAKKAAEAKRAAVKKAREDAKRAQAAKRAADKKAREDARKARMDAKKNGGTASSTLGTNPGTTN
jgi:hypothetical protein